MKKTIAIVVIWLMILPSLTVGATTIEVDINSLDADLYKEQWDQYKKISFEYEGINVTVTGTFTTITAVFKEVLGRDVTLKFKIPKDYISTSALGNIKSDNNVTIDWRTTENYTIATFDLLAFQSTTLTISKGDLIIGRLRKGVHNFWHYVEYNSDADGSEMNLVTVVNKTEPGFIFDNKHIIVQYKTSTLGWYYPVDDVSSNDVYYYVDDLGDSYRIVTHFKTNHSGDVRIQVFPGASKGINFESVRGALARFWISSIAGVKKILLDWFGDTTPSYE